MYSTDCLFLVLVYPIEMYGVPCNFFGVKTCVFSLLSVGYREITRLQGGEVYTKFRHPNLVTFCIKNYIESKIFHFIL